MNNIKKSLLAVGMSLVLCFSLLMGTTYAWFTSSVTNNENKISAGTLSIGAYAYDSKTASVDGGTTVKIDGKDYHFAKDGQDLKKDNKASIDETNFDPNKTYAKLYEVKNEGTLPFKFRFDFCNAVDGGLGNVLWFDFIPLNENNQPEGALDKAKTLNELEAYLNDDKGTELESDKNKKYIFIYGLVNGTSNYYEGNTFKFDINIEATQVNGEFEVLPKDEVLKEEISSASGLDNMMKYIRNGNNVESKITESIKLENTMTLKENQTVKLEIAKDVVFDIPSQVKSTSGFKNSQNNKAYTEKAAITVKNGATLELTGEGTLKSDDYYAVKVEEGGTLKIKGVTIDASNGYKGGIYRIYSQGILSVEKATINAFTDNDIKSSLENPSPLGGSTAYGIYAAGGTLTVRGCKIHVTGATNGNTGNGANGIYVNGATDVVVRDTTITGTGEGTSQTGIYCFGGSIELISNVNIDIKGTAVDTWKSIERIEKSTLKGSKYSLYNRSNTAVPVTKDTTLDGDKSGNITQVE